MVVWLDAHALFFFIYLCNLKYTDESLIHVPLCGNHSEDDFLAWHFKRQCCSLCLTLLSRDPFGRDVSMHESGMLVRLLLSLATRHTAEYRTGESASSGARDTIFKPVSFVCRYLCVSVLISWHFLKNVFVGLMICLFALHYIIAEGCLAVESHPA